jgi:uncharacterized protein (TIGR03083 family)
LQREGDLLAEAAERTDLDTLIPTCPEWTMRDLVQHMGDVHRWAATHVAEGRLQPIKRVEEIAGPLPEDRHLIDWFREGHARLVGTLQTADPNVECWSFLPAPSPLAFWARRQAHETGIHRADAESPSGRMTPFPADLAVDGIEELLFGFLGRPQERDDAIPTRMLGLHALDAGADWLVSIGPEGVDTRRERRDAECSVIAAASDLHLLLWNRRQPDGLDVSGDKTLLDYWRDTVTITWSRPRAT